MIRIEVGRAEPSGIDPIGSEIFDAWRVRADESGVVFALSTRIRDRLPDAIAQAQGPFVPEEAILVAWDEVPDMLGFATRTRFGTERDARVALVATRLGARRTISRFALVEMEQFAIERDGREIEIAGIGVPLESLRTIVEMIQGGEW